eukprot:scaffold237553_cov33-Attheya_sp.AAC.1
MGFLSTAYVIVWFLHGFHSCKSRLLRSGAILEVHGRIMIPSVVVICFGRIGLGYGWVGLIRHRVVRHGGRRRSNKSTTEARKQDMPPHFFKISLGCELTSFS